MPCRQEMRLLLSQIGELWMPTRREFLKKAAYVAPAVVTLSAVPAFAGSGSGYGSKGSRGGHGG